MKKFVLALAFLFCGSVFIAPSVALAQNRGMVRSTDNPQAIQQSTSYDGSFREGVLTIINYVLSFVGLIAVVMFIYGGVLYIVAAGDDTDKPKKILLYAALGILVILLSFAIANTLLGAGNVDSGGEL